MPGNAYKCVKGWAAALDHYTKAYNTRSVRIAGPAGVQGHTPGAAPSPFATPVRQGNSSNPISVHSSPAPASPTPAQNGSRYNPMLVQSSPALAPAVTHTTPATGTRHQPVSVQSSPVAPFSPKRPNTPAFSSHNDEHTPPPVTPRPKAKHTGSEARIRAIEEALEHYAARNNTDIPLPVTPTSNPFDETRIAAIENCLNDLLTREAQRVSMREASLNAERREKLTAMFERARLQFLAQRGHDGRDPTPPRNSVEGNGGRTPAPPQAPAAGSSTGPGTAPTASSEEINYFAGFDDEEYTKEELAQLEKLLNGEV